MFCHYSSSKLSSQKFEFSFKVKGLNPGYLPFKIFSTLPEKYGLPNICSVDASLCDLGIHICLVTQTDDKNQMIPIQLPKPPNQFMYSLSEGHWNQTWEGIDEKAHGSLFLTSHIPNIPAIVTGMTNVMGMAKDTIWILVLHANLPKMYATYVHPICVARTFSGKRFPSTPTCWL